MRKFILVMAAAATVALAAPANAVVIINSGQVITRAQLCAETGNPFFCEPILYRFFRLWGRHF